MGYRIFEIGRYEQIRKNMNISVERDWYDFLKKILYIFKINFLNINYTLLNWN